MKSQAIGEAPFSIVTDNLRIITAVTSRDGLSGLFSLSVAQTDFEKAASTASASAGVLPESVAEGEALGLSLVQYNNNPLAVLGNSTTLTVRTSTYSTTSQESSRRRLAVDSTNGG